MGEKISFAVDVKPVLIGKSKAPRLSRNTKPVEDDKSRSLKESKIIAGVAKGAVCSSEDDGPDSTTKSPKVSDELSPSFEREVTEHSPEAKKEQSDIEPPADPAATLLAQQMELEQAVQNIAKMTENSTLQSYKEVPVEPPVLLPPVIEEPQCEIAEEKPANPASETELAAAIDSITAEDISGDADSFAAPPNYTSVIPPAEQLVIPSASEVMEPETHLAISNIMNVDAQMQPLSPESKLEEPAPGSSVNKEVSPLPETPKKVGKGRPKAQKRSRTRKISASRKGETSEECASETEPTSVKMTKSVSEETSTLKSNVAGTFAAAAATVSSSTVSCEQEAGLVIVGSVDAPKEAEQPPLEPKSHESAFHLGNKSPSHLKIQQPLTELPATPFALSPTRLNTTAACSGKSGSPHDWVNNTKDIGTRTAPMPQASMPSPPIGAAPATTVAASSGNPPMPPDTKASDVDPSSSTLRKILMDPQYVSASGGSSVSSTLPTSSLGDPRISDNKTQSDSVIARHSASEDGSSPSAPQLSVQQPPLPPLEMEPTFGEKMVNSVIASTATSVISRIPIPMPFDSEETPRISLSNRNLGIQLPKQKYRPSCNETNRYHGLPMSEEATGVGRPGVESTAYSSGSSPRLRVNTSEGVVVLSCSGQKTEGPQRIIAKISQIPPASAVDIEFQQSVSKSQIKQEPLTPSQPPTPKGSQTPTGYSHAGGVLSQAYNTQPVISSIKQESPGSDKGDLPYHSGFQGKINQQTGSSPQVLVYSQAMMQQHGKKVVGTETLPLKGDVNRSSNLSPGLSPHHPSLTGNYLSSSPSTPVDRSLPHSSGIKQEPHSPRTSGHSPSPFSKTCPPSTSASTIGTSVVLAPGKPAMSQYASSVHHQEQSVIMPPHSVTQTIGMGHLSQGEVRMNTPPLTAVAYGVRPEPLASPRSGAPQRSSTPQPAGIRDIVLQSHPGSAGSGGSSVSVDDESRHFHQSLCRPHAPQLQSEVMVMQPDYRALHHGGLRLDQYGLPPRVLMHHQLGEHSAPDSGQARTPEPAPLSSSSSIPLSSSSKTPPVGKGILGRDTPKALEAKMPSSPRGESRIMGAHPSVPMMVSTQGVQMMQTGAASSLSEYSPVYRDIRGFHHQFPGHSPLGINLATRSITPSQDGDHGARSKTPLSSSGAAAERELGPAVAGQKGSHSFLASSLPATIGPARIDGKLEPAGHRPVDMVQLLMKYPIVWQGHLALKNDSAAVQLHFVCGNNALAHRSLPPPEGGPLLRIAQRMRLEGSQLEGVARRMTVDSDYCLLLALPCGRDQEDVLNQTHALKGGFITYLQAKLAAGIINVPNPGSNQPAYVLHIFPPCEFSESHLSRLAPDLLNSISSISPHLMIVIASA
ncbi:hypothetical protein GJAV_G00178400 [Gymnothorax javanicus]|nr:hypothetical protein GJAV_G00178400 [Gymnothorax javanicus]